MPAVDCFSFTVPGDPHGWQRARLCRGRVFMSRRERELRGEVQRIAVHAMRDQGFTPVTGGEYCFYSCIISAAFKVPASWPKAKRAAALSGRLLPGKPDVDNCAKSVLDALNGVAFEDDRYVSRLTVSKFYSAAEPYVYVFIERVRSGRAKK